MMQRWFLYALSADFFWGFNAVLEKLAVDRRYLGLEVSRSNLFIAVGILATMLIHDRMSHVPFSGEKIPAYALSFAIGIIWALGNIFALSAVRSGGNMSQVVPLYNTNTLIAVILVTLLFREIPAGADLYRVMAGAVLITIGAYLVS